MRLWCVAIMVCVHCSEAAPYQNRARPQTISISDLRHEVENHEIEMRMFEERLNTQEVIVDSLRQQVLDVNHDNQELVKKNTIFIENQVSQLTSSVSGITADIRSLQTQGNSTSNALNQYREKIEQLEKQINQLQESLHLVLNALEGGEPGSYRQYQVESGDTLEKIARKYSTTIKKIKELNQLSSDRIYIGQKLKLP